MLACKLLCLIYVNVFGFLGIGGLSEKFYKKCLTWKRYTLRPMVPDGPAPLPANRINRVAAFEVTGLILGLVLLKEVRKLG
ncbi:hypothetical protein CEXT_104041 [Caerostris extrusa]|uniref:Uncharacterized protein n=1 Tax=Caerostris extrusa TaxID=172846 RepID=A0AAV4N5J1_CAEEX|nr:hypothetical protein CEXT_104041 [Caerostris extrusa]